MVCAVNPTIPRFRTVRWMAFLSLGFLLAVPGIVSAADDTAPSWIWKAAAAGAREEVFFRRTFSLERVPRTARMTVACDNHFELFVNGQRAGSGDSWEEASVFNIRGALREGQNVVAIRGQNAGGIAGLAVVLETGSRRREMNVALVSDGDWRCAGSAGEGWTGPDFDDAGWATVFVHGPMGMAPWGPVFTALEGPGEPQVPVNVTEQFTVPDGFQVEQVYRVPKSTQGSWVSLAVDGAGRLITSDQEGRLYRVTPAPLGEASATTEVALLDLPIGQAHGLLWAFDSLYVCVNGGGIAGRGSGVYRCTDEDGDGEVETVKEIRRLQGGGEHGPHALVLSPDEKWIYVVAGNHTDLPEEIDVYLLPKRWDEDQLLPRQPDAGGHATGRMAPGGWVCRMTPDGEHWELVSGGYRNEYDVAFNEHGDLFTYDADMEWDFGTPWYRPTRICEVSSGSEYGWRFGTGKWPDYFADSLPGVVDIGPGCPTGVVSGAGARFPEPYQKAIYVLDWTFATIYAIHLEPEGAGYKGDKEEFLAGVGLPVTDAVIGRDGAFYFTVGGRNTQSLLYRVSYQGSEATAPAAPDTLPDELTRIRKLRRDLEGFHGRVDSAAVEAAWPHLGSEDRWLRYAARVALEHQPVASWREKVLAEEDPLTRITAAVALGRTGGMEDRDRLLEALGGISWTALDETWRLDLLRALSLACIRLGRPGEDLVRKLGDWLDAGYPDASEPVNRELCRVLVYLKHPRVVEKTLRLMAASHPAVPPDWAALVSRNTGYGNSVLRMLENLPDQQEMHYAYCLKNAPGPWTEGQRRQYFTWFQEALQKSGGNSYRGFLENIRKEALEEATEDERRMVAGWNLETPHNPFADLPPVEGPGQNWSAGEMIAMMDNELRGRDFDRGKKMFNAALCFACHRFGGEGGSAGPDLTAAGTRFSHADLAAALVEPSRVISDQYVFSVISLKDGSALSGRVVQERDGQLEVATNAFDFTQTIQIPRESVTSIEPSGVSPMPPALVNRLNREELLDLLAYMISGGDEAHPAFREDASSGR